MLALDNANYTQTQLKGIKLSGNIPKSEADVLTAGQLNRGMNSRLILHNLAQLENALDLHSHLYQGAQALRSQYGDKLSSVAPDFQLVNSDWWRNTVKHHQSKSREYADQFNKSMSPKAKD